MKQGQPQRRVIVVLGMHRSGTSVTTNLLSELGVSLSEDLMPATEANKRGYFESVEISKIQDTILDICGLKWNTPSTLRPLPADWWHAPAIAPYRLQLREIVVRELERHTVWGFKDPRTCRLLPMWGEIFDEIGVDTSYLLVTRNPSEVAASILTRDRMDPLFAELLWLEHYCDAILRTPKKLSGVVDYQTWMETPLEQAKYMIRALHLQFEGSDSDLQSLIDRVIEPGLRHQAAPSTGFRLAFTAPLYTALRARDLDRAAQICEMLNVSRSFTTLVASRLNDRLAELGALTEQQALRIRALEAHAETLTKQLSEVNSRT